MADWRPMLNRRDNVTPDSFHAVSRSPDPRTAVTRAVKMAADGAEWIDIGGESTRPGAKPVGEHEELARVLPVVEAIRSELPDICISIDTRRSEVARQSLEAGADMVNDVSSLSDPEMENVILDWNCPICLMHMRGLPENMQDDPNYMNVVSEVRGVLSEASGRLIDTGVESSRIVVDPGIGFGKKLPHNLALLSAGREVSPNDDMPLMWGVSRKSMFRDLLGRDASEERLPGTLGVAAIAAEKEVSIIRVHDVAEHSDLFGAMGALR